MPVDANAAKAIFMSALEKSDPPERAAYVSEACGHDDELRQRVEILLKAHEDSSSFMKSPIAGSAAVEVATVDGPITERPGTIIGPYKLLEEIGEGGFGVVFMAEQQQPIRRKVALKLIKPGMDSKQIIARFEAERQALALMDHPNIAKVLDAGQTASGRPFFVMDLVRGVPITDFCDQNRLSIVERLKLFVVACQAVQHAHQKGIIHRDIKPSNVLVTLHDDQALVKVIDFGVAKATGQQLTEKTLFTNFAQMIGTPLYMSPEQAQMTSLDVDTRSDVYSLGVLLYELMTGTTPFDKDRLRTVGFDEIRRIIREEEPPKPSTRISTLGQAATTVSTQRKSDPKRLSQLFRGELDWIVMKALEKDRNRRYETASAFAQDVQRYLADEPVTACPPSAWYRLRKFERRNRGPVLAITITFFVLVCGVFGTTWGMMHAETARAAAQKRLEQLEKGNQILGSIFRDLDPKAQEKEGKPLQAILGERLDAAVEQLKGQSVGDPLTVARLQQTLGVSLAGLGYPEKAMSLFMEAGETFTNLLGGEDPETLSSRMDLASCYHALGRLSESVKLREETLALQKAVLGPDHPSTLITMNNLANSYADLGRREEALKLREETLALRRVVLGPDHPYTLMSMQNLANSHESFARTEDACKLREETVALQRTKLGPASYDTLLGMNNLANSYDALGRYGDALKLREEVLTLRRGKLGPRHPDTLVSMANVATSYYHLERFTEARNLFEETLTLLRGRLGNDHPYTLTCMNGLAAAYTKLGQHAQAVKLFTEVLELRKAKIGPRHPETLGSVNNLIAGYGALHRDADAIKLCEETIPLMKSELGPNHPYTLMCMHNMANRYAALGQYTDAIKLDEETLALMKAKLGSDHPLTLECMKDLAISYDVLRRYSDALGLREQILALRKVKLGVDHPATLASMDDLAVSYRSLNRRADELKLREEWLALTKAKLGPEHPNTLKAMRIVAVRYFGLGKHVDALKLNEETLALSKAKLGSDDPATLSTMHNLANCYDALGRHADAHKLFEETLRLKKAKLGPNHPDTLLTMWGLANSLVQLDLAAEAVPIIDECIQRARGQSVDPNLFTALMELRLRHFQKTQDAAGCRQTAVNWEELGRKDAVSLYQAARMRAVTAAVIRATDKSDASLKAAAAEADKAMLWLNKAVVAGYKNAPQMKTEKDLDSLRDRQDFQKLLAELEGRDKDLESKPVKKS